jgi:site-specific DNA-cytosine methylase
MGKSGKKNKRRGLKQELKDKLIHKRVLPTAQHSRGERYYLPGLHRHVSTEEMGNAFGIASDSSLRKAMRRVGQAKDTKACSMYGGAVQVQVLRCVLRGALARAGLAHPGDGEKLRLASVCCGIGTAAEAMEQETKGRFEYVSAAEKGKEQRKVLKEAWAGRGLTDARMAKEAYDERTLRAAEASDVLIATPDCGKYSRQSMTDISEAMEETAKVAALLTYASEHEPSVVIIENAADLLRSTRMRACGERIEQYVEEALPGYEVRAQVVDAYRHMGLPMERERAFWVATKRAT